ncbi:ABC transporter ATP-binding protein [Rhodococcus oxybenzonivorans]|jgi:ABC-2 type transport system ATP-binding protein|uniref:galactan export ABC transporter ATP-binding subunit Wzt/RfbE n=1 Tax=Rhodococcus TaxID=1827 RepID=UPI00131FF761|nr:MULTISPECIES: ABC transporter ATP-binding protein [Rhodococcus]MDV7355374.1 ABC transporter ATP-binding protein [Rhodococcus oxybenzonivorans]QHE67038.1 O-antigen/lipopolysaccharide transport ATP-binding protein ABC transporter RfbE [Rhodococcus sp. WAY2]
MTEHVSIETRDACVDFPIFDAKSRSLKKAFLGKAGGSIGRNSSDVVVVEALRDITLSLKEGDRIGLVGHNGAGKSTLLRLLSGIYEPTRGSASIRGRVAPVFDLGVGMDPEISGYENIIIRGLFLGQTRKQMLAKMDEIAEFTELGEYLSMPLRTYSTGMRVRVAMGVVTSIDPEILLLDEGIGAVDAEFMKKARVRLQALVERSGILVFASHSNEFLAQLCDTAMWIDHGRIRQQGGIEDVVRAYEGDDAADHVRHVIYELEREKAGLTAPSRSYKRDAGSAGPSERSVPTGTSAGTSTGTEAESA